MCKIIVVGEADSEIVVEYKPYQYKNLMELIYNEIWEEWGDCRGRAICGTCHIEILNNDVVSTDSFEQHTLNGLPNKTSRSRLACQIVPDRSINNLKFRILRDYY